MRRQLARVVSVGWKKPGWQRRWLTLPWLNAIATEARSFNYTF